MRNYITHFLQNTLRLAAATLCGIAISLIATTLHAEIVYVDLATNLNLDTPSETIPLDIDNNGQNDFLLFYDLFQGDAFLHINVPAGTASTNKVVVTGNKNVYGKDEVRGLNEGVTISSFSKFNGSVFGNGPLVAQPSSAGGEILEGLGRKYVGCKFSITGQTHYGWIEVEVDGFGSLCTVYSYAYESTPNESIDAGDIGVTPVEMITVEGELGFTSIDTPGGQLLMVATVAPSDATDKSVTWSVDDENVATIDQEGVLTAQSNGTVEVTARANDGSGVSGSKEIEVTNQTVLVETITVMGSGGQTSIDEPNGTLQMIATVTPENASDPSLEWSVDLESVATIDQSGLLTAQSNGTVTITVTAQDGSDASGSTEIDVQNQPVLIEEISVEGSGGISSIDKPGGTLQMIAMITPADATDQGISWSVNDADLATISSDGLLTAKANGTVHVTATAEDGSGIKGSTSIMISNQTTMSVSEPTDVALQPMRVDDGVVVTNGTIQLRWSQPSRYTVHVELHAVTGETVYAKTIAPTQTVHTISTGDIPSGLYILQATCERKSSSVSRVLLLAE